MTNVEKQHQTPVSGLRVFTLASRECISPSFRPSVLPQQISSIPVSTATFPSKPLSPLAQTVTRVSKQPSLLVSFLLEPILNTAARVSF